MPTRFADSSFDGAGPDIGVVAAQLGVAHAVLNVTVSGRRGCWVAMGRSVLPADDCAE